MKAQIPSPWSEITLGCQVVFAPSEWKGLECHGSLRGRRGGSGRMVGALESRTRLVQRLQERTRRRTAFMCVFGNRMTLSLSAP